MDVGFTEAGFRVVWANDYDKSAVGTYQRNHGSHITHGDIRDYYGAVSQFSEIDCVFGGPPCQGFSVAGKMDLNDPRSQLVKSFMEVVQIVRPRAFVMENVKALATLSKFRHFRRELQSRAEQMGFRAEMIILNSKDFGVPQARKRLFFVGFLEKDGSLIGRAIRRYFRPDVSTFEAISSLGVQGTDQNPKTCNAVVTLAANPILRRSPYAGMLFNGLGRPIDPNAPSPTLPASMGGNKTPIIDERQFYGDGKSWVEDYHRHLTSGGEPFEKEEVPPYLRRLTIAEAGLLHTFPNDYEFVGGNSAVYRQIGNAVPCDLARAVGAATIDILDGVPLPDLRERQLSLV